MREREMENVRGSWSGGRACLCQQTVVDVSPNSHSASDSILLEQCWWLWSSHQEVHPKGSIFNKLLYFLPTYLFPSIWVPDTLFSIHNRKEFALSMRFIATTLFCGSFINCLL